MSLCDTCRTLDPTCPQTSVWAVGFALVAPSVRPALLPHLSKADCIALLVDVTDRNGLIELLRLAAYDDVSDLSFSWLTALLLFDGYIPPALVHYCLRLRVVLRVVWPSLAHRSASWRAESGHATRSLGFRDTVTIGSQRVIVHSPPCCILTWHLVPAFATSGSCWSLSRYLLGPA